MDFEQRSPEWFAKRAGAFTASRMADLMARTKSGYPAASRKNMIATLAIERLTGECVPTYSNSAMERGIDLEQEAINAYSFETGSAVQSAAYIDHKSLERVGCSPDGLVGATGLVEVKCPASMSKHLDALRSGQHATEYRWQLQHQLFVSERLWVDAVSYDPRFPVGLQLAIKRIEPVDEDQSAIAEEIEKASAEIAEIVAELRALNNAEAA